MICTKCKTDKPNTEFHFKGVRRKDGSKSRRAACAACCNTSKKAWSASHKEHIKQYGKQYRQSKALPAVDTEIPVHVVVPSPVPDAGT